MSLAAIQTTMGRRILSRTVDHRQPNLTPAEHESLMRLFAEPGFLLTQAIQRSWCEGRAARGATLTLSCLPTVYRKQLLTDWVNQGGGANSFLLAEAVAFLAFLKPQLAEHPHAHSLCCFEEAILRAQEAADEPRPSKSLQMSTKLTTGHHATLVNFLADPESLLAAVNQSKPLPNIASDPFPLLIAPRLPNQVRPAEAHDLAFWNNLSTPKPIHELLNLGHTKEQLSDFLNTGLAEPV